MKKQRRRACAANRCTITAHLIRAVVFATWIVQFLYFINPNFKASGHLLWLTARFASDLVGNFEDRFAHDAAQLSC